MADVTENATDASILWRRVDRPGHESARVKRLDALWQLQGSAVFVENSQAVRLDYEVICDRNWNSRSASVVGWLGDADVVLDVRVTDDGQWSMNGEPQPGVTGCRDLDLNFSPSTNLLPIRRLNLAVGEARSVRAAWLRFPSFCLEVLEQTYRRTAALVYEYESGGGRFKAELHVNDVGFPTEYAGIWRIEA